MNTSNRLVLAAAMCVLCAQSALAGAPLKGIDVKLGKNPGGGCAARTTNGAGTANFGIWPKGNYTLSVVPITKPAATVQSTSRVQKSDAQPGTPVSVKMHLEIMGVAGGKIERDIVPAMSSARVEPIQILLNGTEELIVVVSAEQ